MQQQLELLENQILTNHPNITGVVVQKNGKQVYQNYYSQTTSTNKIHVYSITKSIVSLLIGIALEKGHIKSIHQKVLDFFPNYQVKQREHTIQHITIKHLLTMTAPYKYTSTPYIKYFTSNDWVQFSLDLLGGKNEIGSFNYAPLVGPDILSGILSNTTGLSLLQFAQKHVFSPLGIKINGNLVFHTKEEQLSFNASIDANGWAADKAGTNSAGWGLTLSPADMAKIGQLYLNGGQYNGKQIVSKNWILESTKQHSLWAERHLPYGYLWWVINPRGPVYAAMGDGGNIIYVHTKQQLVVSIASLFIPHANDRIQLIQKYIEPLFTT